MYTFALTCWVSVYMSVKQYVKQYVKCVHFKMVSMKVDKINELLDLGYNCMPINSNKTPLQGWKKYQDEKITSLDLFKKKSDYYALICGYNDVECIDVDLKVLPNKIDRVKFAKELFQMLEDNIEDFKGNFTIKRTRSNGYHIIYKADNIEGNMKLSVLDGYTEAIIETRGIGGYICMYEPIRNNDYKQIKKITDHERDIVIGVCRSFNQVHDQEPEVTREVLKEYKKDINTVTPWDDFNNKNTILSVINNEFDVVGRKRDKTLIRRFGAKSPHSGYIFDTSNCMYLFSTGTIYEAQKLISPFTAYSVKVHNGDFSKAASVLYSEGYGDRAKIELKEKIVIKPLKTKAKIQFPTDIFPYELNVYMTECARTLSNSIDYLGSSFLWVSSLIIGNALNIEVKKGWKEISTIWVSLVGEAGVGKTPSVDSIMRPLDIMNGEEKRKFQRDKEEYDQFLELTKKERSQVGEVREPKRTQFIVDDVTIEALINLHSQNSNGVGVHKDELAGWFKDMNKYKEGSDKEQWLSSWSGKGINVDRVTRQSDYIQKPILPVLGGIQPSILSNFFTSDNRDSGFLDRMLFCYPDLKVEKYNEDEMTSELLDYYDNWVKIFHQEMRKITTYNDFGDIKPITCNWSSDAKKEWIKCFNLLTERQNSDETPEFLKSYIPKMKSYLPRFSLLLNTLDAVHNGTNMTVISLKSVKDSFKLVNYFIDNNVRIITLNTDLAETNEIMNSKRGLSNIDKLRAIMKSGKDFNKAQVARELNISRTLLYSYITKIKKESDKN